MRSDPSAFAAKNLAAAKRPRFVVKIGFASPIYISSHTDISGVPSTHLAGYLQEPSHSSQKLNPDQGRAEIGAASFTVVDLAGEFTSQLRTKLAGGEGLRDKTVSLYLGYQGLAWSDFVLVGTQIVKNAAFDKGSYQVSCNDIQRSARKDIFNLAQTTIATTIEPADTTITVYSTAGFNLVKHGTSYTDGASSTVGYIKIKDEVIRYTGTTSTTFTGCTRGVLGTSAGRYVADGSTSASRREKVTEYVYLELPGPKLAYAILTGVLYGDSANLPSNWHLGIDTALVKTADFTGIGTDLWDTASDANGVILRFEGLQKTDGKAFIELEILRLLGLYMPVTAAGQLGLRRMTSVLSDAAGAITLDETNSVMVGELEHDMESLHNSFSVLWNWNGKDYTRATRYIDATSAARHGTAPELELKFKGLYGGRHTDGLIFKLLDSIRDRYSAPPCRLQIDVLHSLNVIEVGDVVRVHHTSVRDYAGQDSHIDRAFEVQSISVNHRTGAVSLDLFGSTSRASIISPTTAVSALPDAFYTAAGTNLATVWTITSGVVSGGPYTLAGGTDLTAAGSIWYYNGDLTIPDGVTVNITGNVQIRVKGYLTVNGIINGTGGGLAGVADNSSATTIIAGNPGWVGNSRGLDGVKRVDLTSERAVLITMPPAVTQAKNASFPYISLDVSGSTLKGLPTDLRGTGGGPGGKVVHTNGTFYKSGGTGGAGGAGLCTISRGFGVGASGSITLNGADTSAPTAHQWTQSFKTVNVFPGTGGAGGPGSFLLLIDGGLLSAPDLSGRFVARTGVLGLPAAQTALSGVAEEKLKLKLEPFCGYIADPSVISGMDLSFSAQRIQYVPAPETAAGDTINLAGVTNLTITQGSSGYTVGFTPSAGAPLGTVYEVWEYTSNTPFSSATKVAEGAASTFFIPRGNTTTVYCWVRARYKDQVTGVTYYSDTTPSGNGLAAGAAATAGTYATATPTSISGSAASSSITTGSVTASLVGGTGTTFSWARQSGSTAISANSASAATTTFSATGVATNSTVSAVFRCTINSTYTIDVTVSCTNSTPALSISASPTSVSKTGSGTSLTTASVTATASGGAGGNSFAWTKVSGGTITADTSSSATTTFTATSLGTAESRSATFRCTVTDGAAATATVDVTVTITRAAMAVTLNPTALDHTGQTSTITTDTVTGTASGGTGPYSYQWTKISGDNITANSPNSAGTTFTAANMSKLTIRQTTFRCTATDSLSATAYAEILVSITRGLN